MRKKAKTGPWTLRRMPYSQYLQTKHWKGLRGFMLRRFKTCQNCGRDYGLQVHHKTYKRLGREDALADLVVLCAPCHHSFHTGDDDTLTGSMDVISLRDGTAEAAEVCKELCTKIGPLSPAKKQEARKPRKKKERRYKMSKHERAIDAAKKLMRSRFPRIKEAPSPARLHSRR